MKRSMAPGQTWLHEDGGAYLVLREARPHKQGPVWTCLVLEQVPTWPEFPGETVDNLEAWMLERCRRLA